MSALAQIMSDLGYTVMGSDKPDHFFTEAGLIKKGIKFFEFNADNIKKNMIIVQGNAFTDEHPEVKKAHELGLKIFTYQEMIAEITNDTKLIAVCGCHGKTTTTTMLSKVLENVGVNYLIGDGTGYATVGNEYFALEACEYKRHFLAYNPYYVIVTNIELDHTDYYKDLDDVLTEYASFFVLLDHIEDPHNLGAIVRTCEAAGVDAIIMPRDRQVQVNATVMKTSVGTLENVNIVTVSNLNNTISELKKNGFWVVGTALEDSVDYRSIDYSSKIALVIGNENFGMSNLVKKSCDFIAKIPMYGTTNSLNASVAAGIMIYEVIRNRK